MQNSLRRRAVSALIWSAVGQSGSQGIHYVVVLVLAWLLSPGDFGLVGLAMIFISFSQVVGELGLTQALVQRPNVEEPVLSTAFWANLVVSVLLALLTLIGADLITGFLGNSNAAPMLRGLSVVFPITALAVVPDALLRKNLEFNRLARRGLVSELAFGIAGPALALMGAGAWSLVGAIIAQRAAQTTLLWVVVPWRPKLIWNRQSFRQLLGFGSYAMLSGIFNRGFSNIDYFVVGKWIGTEALGYYTLAFQLAAVPLGRLTGMLHQVAFPTFSIIQDDRKRLKAGFAEGMMHLFAVLLPVSLLLAGLGPYLIEALYGRKWLAAVLPLQFLALGGFFHTFDMTGSIYLAMGKPQFRLWINLLRTILFSAFIPMFGLSLGISGVAISLSLSVALSGVLSLVLVRPMLEATWMELLQPLWPTLRAALCALAPAIAAKFFLPSKTFASWHAAVGLAALMTLVFIGILAPSYLPRLRNLLSRERGPRVGRRSV